MKRQIIGLALCLALLGASSAQALVIDNFDTPQPIIFAPPGGSNTTPAPDPVGSIAAGGGTRDMSLTFATDPGTPFSFDVIAGGSFILAAGPGGDLTASLTWTPPAPVDLLDGCTSLAECYLIFGVDSLDHQLTVVVTLSDGTNTASNTYLKAHHPIPPDPAGAEALICTNGTLTGCPQIVGPIYGDTGAGVFGNYYHGLSLFNSSTAIDPARGVPFGGSAPGPVDFTSITSIIFSLSTPTTALDFSIDCVYTGSRASTGFESKTTPLVGGGTVTQSYPTFTDPADGARNACLAQVTDIPEPASLLLMGTGLLGVGLFGLRKRSLRRRQQA